jgi:hypothetical protein
MLHRTEHMGYQRFFEQTKSLGWFTRRAQALAKLPGCRSPQRFQIDVCVRQLTDCRAQKRKRAAGTKIDAYNRRMLARINYKRACICPGNHRTRKPFAILQLRWLVDAKLVFVEIDHQFHCSAWNNPLFEVRRTSLICQNRSTKSPSGPAGVWKR